jgi:hypothetical protein
MMKAWPAADRFRPVGDQARDDRGLRHVFLRGLWQSTGSSICPSAGRHRCGIGIPLSRSGAGAGRSGDLYQPVGETADTLAALRHCKANGQTIAVVVNVPTSSMAREADLLLPTHAGPEIGVASTKAFTRQLAVLAALAAHLAVKRAHDAR